MLWTKLLNRPTVRRREFKVDEVAGVVDLSEYNVSCGTEIEQVKLVAGLKRLFGIDGRALSPDTFQVRHSAAAIPL